MKVNGEGWPGALSSAILSSVQTIGVAAALASAASWALCSVLWRKVGDELSPVAMNLAKGLLGSLLLCAALAAAGPTPIGAREAAFLAASGVLGVSLGDTLFFRCLVTLGPRRTTLLSSLTPIATALLAVAILGERPSAFSWLGIAAAVGGTTWVMLEGAGGERGEIRAAGLRDGLASVACMAAGTILAKLGASGTGAVEATLIRVAAGFGALALWGAGRGNLRELAAALSSPRKLRPLVLVVAIGTFGGFLLSIVALRRTEAWLAGTLFAMVPLFVMPMTALAFGERAGWRTWAGTAVAAAGLALACAA
jgi:drug/metabolite transporter (DMT)-like permease